VPDFKLCPSFLQHISLPIKAVLAIVGQTSQQLSWIIYIPSKNMYTGFVRRIQVLEFYKKCVEVSLLFFSSGILSLDFDLGRWMWDNGHQLSNYTTSTGRQLLTKSHQLKRSISSKWIDHLQPDFLPDW